MGMDPPVQQLGWTSGRNLRIDYFWGLGQADTISKHAVELAALAPDVILASGTAIGQFAVIQSVAPAVGVDVIPVSVRDAAEIERAVAAFARASNGGLAVTSSALTNGRSTAHLDLWGIKAGTTLMLPKPE